MKFGKIEDLEGIDFTFTKEFELNPKVLGGKGRCELRIGLSKWGDKSWVGRFYTKNLSQANYLSHYASLFNSIEINATYYRIFKPEVAHKWVEQVSSKDFKFYLKLPAALSGGDLDVKYKRITDDYLAFVDALGDNYGGTFVQYNGKPSDKSFDFISGVSEYLPNNMNLFWELRHKDWFSPKENFGKVFGELSGANFVLTDTPGRRDVFHLAIPNSRILVRYVGYDFNEKDRIRLQSWKKKIEEWQGRGLQEFVFLIHNSNPTKSLEMRDFLLK